MKQKGISLIELNITLLLVGLLAAISIPTFLQTLKHQEYVHVKNQLVHAVNFARIESINLNQPVRLQANDANWCHGWRVMLNDKAIRSYLPEIQSCNIAWKGFPNKRDIAFLPQGMTDYQNGTFRFSVDGELLWSLVLNQAGRLRIK